MEKRIRITSEEINALPLRAWEGRVDVITDPSEIDSAVKEIKKHRVIGFDTESKPAFRKGEYNPVSLIQVAIPDHVFLFRVNITGFASNLADLFSSERITKVGVAIYDDIKELRRLREFEPAKVIELSQMAEKKGIINAGVRGLTGLLLDFRISKRQQTSNWENKKLTKSQITYAATDAWVCLEIYEKMIRMPDAH
jgi:ribonuclease D